MDIPPKISDSPPRPYEDVSQKGTLTPEPRYTLMAGLSRSGPSHAETERMRRFLLHVLKIDYKIDRESKLAKGDWVYFTQLSQSLNKLESTELPKRTNEDVEVLDVLGEYSNRHIFDPAQALCVPAALVQDMVCNWTHSINPSGRGQSMLHEHLEDGFRGLATRLFVDKEITIGAVVAPEDVELKSKLLEAVQHEIGKWFSEFDSPDCFTVKADNVQALTNLPNRLALVRSIEPSFFLRPIPCILAALKKQCRKYIYTDTDTDLEAQWVSS